MKEQASFNLDIVSIGNKINILLGRFITQSIRQITLTTSFSP